MVEKCAFHFELPNKLIVLRKENERLVNSLGDLIEVGLISELLPSSEEGDKLKDLQTVVLNNRLGERLDIIGQNEIIEPAPNKFLRLFHRLLRDRVVPERSLRALV